jgi:hypothetical protein
MGSISITTTTYGTAIKVVNPHFSLLQSLDLGARTLRLHDNMIWYLRDRIGPEGGRAANQAMIQALGAACDGKWETLPAQHAYGWRFLIRICVGPAGVEKQTGSLLITLGSRRS